MKKFMSLLLSVLLVLSLVPMTISATEKDWNSFVYTQDGATFSVKATEFEGNKDRYDFYAAGYDSTGKLLEIKKGEAIAADGELNGEVSFETIVNGAVTKEANPKIKTVKTMVWDGMTPIVRAGEFKNIDDTGLTNGFYEPVLSGKVASETRYGWRDDDNNGTIDSYLGSWSDSNKHDGDLNTKNGVYGPINNASAFASGELAVAQYITELTESVEIDRVVVYYDVMSTPDNEMRFYLAKSLGAQSGKDTYFADFNETTHGDITYLGYRGTNAGVVTDGVAKLVFEADGAAYKYLVADMNKNSDYGYVYEWQAYKKRAAKTDVVDEFTINVDYNGLSYSQDGPEFTVTAKEFETNATELYVMATAYDAADAKGTVLAQERQKLDIAETLTGTVDIEKNGEVNPLMASVKVEVVDNLGNNVLDAWTKNVTPQSVGEDGVYTNLTNGFYKPVIDGENVLVASCARKVWNSSQEQIYSGSEGANIYDSNPTTRSGNSGGIGAGNRAQYIMTLNRTATIDRVIVYTGSGMDFYLANDVDASSGNAVNHLARFNGANGTGVYFLGDRNTVTGTTVGSATRLVLDADGGSYQYLVADMLNTNGDVYALYDFVAYQKLTDSHTVSETETRVNWDSVTFSQNGPVFSVATEGFETNNTDLYIEAVAYADGTPVASVRKPVTFPNGELAGVADFEENGEADVTISSVSVAVTDADGNVIVEAEEAFAITPQSVGEDGVYTNLTNGFYAPVVDGVNAAIASCARKVWNSSQALAYSGSEGANIYDSNPTTRSANSGGIGAGNRAQYIISLNRAATIDRVIVYTGSGMDFYLTNDVDASNAAAYLARFNGANSDSGVCFLGDTNTVTGTATANSGTRLVLDADGASYRYLVADMINTNGDVYALYDFVAYQKVTASKAGVRPNAQ